MSTPPTEPLAETAPASPGAVSSSLLDQLVNFNTCDAAFYLLAVELLLVVVLIAPLSAATRRSIKEAVEALGFLYTPAKYFTGIVAIVWVLAFRESLQAKADKSAEGTGFAGLLRQENRVYRSQRDVYICGFAFLLLLVMYRLFGLLKEVTQLAATKEALTKQALQAKEYGDSLREQKEALEKAAEARGDAPGPAAGFMDKTEAEDELEIANEAISELRARNTKLTGELETATKSMEAIRRQAEGVTKEYERVMREKESLENKLADFEREWRHGSNPTAPALSCPAVLHRSHMLRGRRQLRSHMLAVTYAAVTYAARPPTAAVPKSPRLHHSRPRRPGEKVQMSRRRWRRWSTGSNVRRHRQILVGTCQHLPIRVAAVAMAVSFERTNTWGPRVPERWALAEARNSLEFIRTRQHVQNACGLWRMWRAEKRECARRCADICGVDRGSATTLDVS